MAASATLALKAGVWFRRGRRCMVSPDSRVTACPPSGRNSTYRPVQISGTGSKGTRGLQRCEGVGELAIGIPAPACATGVSNAWAHNVGNRQSSPNHPINNHAHEDEG